MQKEFKTTEDLAISITKEASLQTAYTIRFLADYELMADAYRAYAYFRWVDDWIDRESLPKKDRIAFVNRQNALLLDFTKGVRCQNITPEEQMLAAVGATDRSPFWRNQNITPEEQMLVELVQSDRDPAGRSGLQSYIHNMMAVMAFDAERRGRLISKSELTTYAHTLAVAVTEAMHYFIGHNCDSPCGEARYLAVTGAHITHMLRDTLEDNAAGYFNIPSEYLKAYHITPLEVESDPYRDWVKSRVQLARSYFKAGRDYMAQVKNFRCRIAGYAYIARFETVLDLIERDDYFLRARYPERKTLAAAVQMCWSTFSSALNERSPQAKSRALTVR
jgi:Squalene/phytoene synthase